MTSIIESMRAVIGTPDFILGEGVVDFGAMIEYIIAALLLVVVVSSVFKVIVRWFG